MSDMSKKALDEFLGEAQEIIDSLNSDLLELDSGINSGKIDPEILNNIFRGAHSLKGLSGMFGITKMSTLSHNMENLLDALRLGKVKLKANILDIMFECIEIFNAIIEDISRRGDGPGINIEEILFKIEEASSQKEQESDDNPLKSIDIDKGILDVLTEYEEYRLIENINQGLYIYKVHTLFDLMSFDQDLADLTAKIKPFGEVITTLPSSESEEVNGIEFDIIFGSEQELDSISSTITDKHISLNKINQKTKAKPKAEPEPVKEVKEVKEVSPPVAEISVEKKTATLAEPIPKPTSTPIGAKKTEGYGSLKSVSQTVRVDIKKLDHLMNIVGELVLIKTNMQRISDLLKMEQGFQGFAVDLYKECRQFDRKLDELQDGVMEVRMVQLRQIFDKLSRVVRKISRDAGKEINFHITGADTELDKLIVEELSDPLMHIIRNCIDHGIEIPTKRVENEKKEAGNVWIRAYQKGNHVIMEVEDDGSGLDYEKIGNIAVERGLIEPEKLTELSKREIFNFIFLPGFSTKQEISEISGRGVGMDVVKTNISNLSGIIDIQSDKGVGTKITMTLPITLAIIKALIIRICHNIYAISLNSVLEIIVINSQDIRTIEKKEVIQLRGDTLPLLRLSKLFNVDSPNEYHEKLFVIVVGLAQNRLGIIVDQLLDQQDIVIKPLGPVLSTIKGIAGATDLGNHQTILVLDIGALIEEALTRE